MHYTLTDLAINLAILLATAVPALLICRKERRLRIEANMKFEKEQERTEIVRLVYSLDETIFRMKIDDPEDWPGSEEAQSLIRRRVRLQEPFADTIGGHSSREMEYVNGLKELFVSKTVRA